MQVLQVAISLYTGGAEKLIVDSIPIYKQKEITMELLLLNGNDTPFFQVLKKSKVKTHYLTTGNIKKIYNPFLVLRIVPYIRKYAIVHVHLFPTLYWVALAKICSFSNTKLIFTEHSTSNTRIKKGGIWRIMDKFIYQQYDKIVSITSDVNTIINSHLSAKSNKFRVITNGIDLSEFSKVSHVQTEDIDTPSVKLIQIAGFRTQKDQPTLIRSLQYLPEYIQCLLVGDGETRSQCEQLVKALNLSNRVSFLGIRTDIPQLLKSSDIVVLSSHWEGFGLAAVEGMAVGKPVIVSDVPGLRDVVYGAGLLFEKGNEKDLAKKINMLLSDPEFYRKVSLACLERSKQYDINVMVDKYIQLYKELNNGYN